MNLFFVVFIDVEGGYLIEESCSIDGFFVEIVYGQLFVFSCELCGFYFIVGLDQCKKLEKYKKIIKYSRKIGKGIVDMFFCDYCVVIYIR